jgi:hypothetical protein
VNICSSSVHCFLYVNICSFYVNICSSSVNICSSSVHICSISMNICSSLRILFPLCHYMSHLVNIYLFSIIIFSVKDNELFVYRFTLHITAYASLITLTARAHSHTHARPQLTTL